MYSLWSNLFFYIFFGGSRLRRGVGLTAHASSSPSFFFFSFFCRFSFVFFRISFIEPHTHKKKTRTKKNGFRSFFFRSRHKQTDRQTHGRTDARTDRQPRDKTATDAIDLLGRLFPLWRAARWPVDTPLVDSFSLSLSLFPFFVLTRHTTSHLASQSSRFYWRPEPFRWLYLFIHFIFIPICRFRIVPSFFFFFFATSFTGFTWFSSRLPSFTGFFFTFHRIRSVFLTRT